MIPIRRPYGFRAYYNADALPRWRKKHPDARPGLGPREGELAIEVRWTTRDDRDMEAALAEERPDIGLVERFQDGAL